MSVSKYRGEDIEVTTSDGVKLAGNWHAPNNGRHGAVLLLPAVAAPSRTLGLLAHALAEQGIGVLRGDYRYTGDSKPTANRSHDASMADLADKDVPALLAALKSRANGLPLACAGHSLGGKLSALMLAQYPDDVKAAVLITVSKVDASLWQGWRRYPVSLAFWLYPWMARVAGRLPAAPVGMGVATPKTMMEEWGRWGATGSYTTRDGGWEQRLTQVRGPVLSIGATDDVLYAPDAAMQGFLAMMPLAQSSRWMLTPQETGARKLGHFGLLRPPAVKVLAHRMAGWLNEAFQHR